MILPPAEKQGQTSSPLFYLIIQIPNRESLQNDFHHGLQIAKNPLIVQLVDGPFKQLEGFWRFEDRDENHSEVILDLEFELSNKIMAMMFGPVFQQVAGSLVDAFVVRAKEIYGGDACYELTQSIRNKRSKL